MHDYAQEIGFKLMLEVANPRFLREKEYLRLLETRRADGMLHVASTIGDTHLLAFRGQPAPLPAAIWIFPDRA